MEVTPYFIGYAIAAPISFIASICLMRIVFLRSMKIQSESQRIHLSNVFWMSFSDYFLSLRFFLQFIGPVSSSKLLCTMSACLGVFFGLTTINWYFVISLSIFFMTQSNSYHQVRHRNIYHAYAWLTSLTVAILLYIFYHQNWDQLVQGDGTCYLPKHGYHRFSRLAIMIPLTIYLSFAVFLLIHIWFLTRKLSLNQEWKTILIRVAIFVSVFFGSWIWKWLTQLFILLEINIDEEAYFSWFRYVETICVSGSGFFNWLVWYVVTPDRCCCKLNVEEEITYQPNNQQEEENNSGFPSELTKMITPLASGGSSINKKEKRSIKYKRLGYVQPRDHSQTT